MYVPANLWNSPAANIKVYSNLSHLINKIYTVNSIDREKESSAAISKVKLFFILEVGGHFSDRAHM